MPGTFPSFSFLWQEGPVERLVRSAGAGPSLSRLPSEARLGLKEEVIPQVRPPPQQALPVTSPPLLPCSLSPVSQAIMKLGFHLQTN